MAERKNCPRSGDRTMPDKPPFPHINCIENVALPIHWGWIGKAFILGIVSTFGSVAWLGYAQVTGAEKHDTTDARDTQIEENIDKMDRNMRKIDENQRIQEAQTGLIVKQMNKLLELGGVTERIQPPKVRPTEMEPIE